MSPRIAMSSHSSRRSDENRFYDVGGVRQPGLGSRPARHMEAADQR